MVIGIIGESCTGKSTLAKALASRINAEVISGKDYIRMSKNESEAASLFRQKLAKAVHGNSIIYVITEKDQLAFLPDQSVRIVITADLETIQERFAQRMHGNLPAPVKMMLERKHGCFDHEPCDLHLKSETLDIDQECNQILSLLGQ